MCDGTRPRQLLIATVSGLGRPSMERTLPLCSRSQCWWISAATQSDRRKACRTESLAAVITSTLFAYSLEINGSASLGAGALEAPTRALRSYPVYDVRDLSPQEHADLRRLVNDVWENEKPVDWLDAKAAPGQYLRRLDEWFLRRAERPVSVHVIYRDLAEVCRLRVSVAKDKTRVTKKSQSESLSRVAMSVAESVRGLLELKRFPEDFMEIQDSDALSLMIAEGQLRQIDIYRLMDMGGASVGWRWRERYL